MAIIKDVTVKINNGTATLDTPVQFYEKDHDVELRFRLMDYKYKYDKDPQNILNSVDEDILEAYTTIVNPRGYELEQINGVVKNDIVIFRLDPTYTDELDELGTYKLQIHIKCTHSEFTIPPITFEVLQRLKGIKVVTDGEDEVDNSEILDNSSKFVSDETGKLIIEWKKGDMISSAKLNAMVDVINDAVDEEKIRQENEIEREKKANNKIQELENTRVEYVNKFDDELDSFADQVNTTMSDYETRFNALTVSQQQDAEIIDARDGEQTLRARLDRDIQKPSIIYEDVEGSYINVDTTCGYAKNVEILGNTIQNQNDLADIRSVGDKLENQELYEIPVLIRGKNLFDGKWIDETVLNLDQTSTLFGTPQVGTGYSTVENFIPVRPNTTYYVNSHTAQVWVVYYDRNKTPISHGQVWMTLSTGDDIFYIRFYDLTSRINNNPPYTISIAKKEEYEPYIEDKLTILSPVQLEKVGDVADRIICKDGVWGVEKNIKTIYTKDFANHISSFENKEGSFKWGKPLDTKMTNVMSNFMPKGSLSTEPNQSQIIIYNHTSYRECRIAFKKADFPNFDVRDNVVQYLSDENKYIKVVQDSQFIPLPHDQQIKLRTFANKTNIHFECEIEPTLKASVPKSIGASVSSHSEQIDILSKELDKVKKLEESTVLTVTTESNFTTVEETANGYFEDVKLEGKTLVNLLNKNSTNELSNSNNGGLIYGVCTHIKPNTEYTIAYYVKASNTFTIPNNASAKQAIVRIDCVLDDLSFTSNIYGLTGDLSTSYRYELAKFTTPSNSNIKIVQLQLRNSYTDAIFGLSSNTLTVKDVIILEGDHTQNPPSFFEGLKSVGDGVDEVSVESINNGNLFNGYYEVGDMNSSNGYDEVNNLRKRSDYIVCKAPKIYFNNNVVRLCWYDKSKQFISYEGNISEAIKPKDAFYFRFSTATSTFDIVNIIASYKQDAKNKNIQSDKKRILYYNDETQTWEKPILREWDSIEKHSDGKYYYHVRSGEVVLDGSENWAIATHPNISSVNTTMFMIFHDDMGINVNMNTRYSLNDKLIDNTKNLELDAEGLIFASNWWNTRTRLLIRKSVSDVSIFKAWLQSNPVTVVYQLAEEKVYECTDLDLITYQNETNLMVKGGAIVPKTMLKVHQNIANIATILQEKVNILENNVGHVNNEIGNINTELTSLTESIEGSCISVDSKDGYLKDIEILGNTIQNQNDLADIRSVGDKLENQELYEIPVLCTNGLDSSDSNYKEHKLTILSPVQLEKVGDVADRIICKDGVWGVEKNINTIVFNGSENWVSASNKPTNTIPEYRLLNAISDYQIFDKLVVKSICNKYIYLGDQDTCWISNNEGFGLGTTYTDTIGTLYICSNIRTLNEFKQSVKGLSIKYPTTQPTFIPLPHDQQIKLRTFANKTNISFQCEIEPTLKASVPKSLSSTVSTHTEQIDNLGKEIDKIKKLEESTVSTVTTESDFTTVTETSNGYFEDVKIEGKTLVNLYPKLDAKNYSNLGATLSNDTITIDANGSWRNFMIKKDVMPLKTSTYYTFVIYIIDNTITGDDAIIHFGDTLPKDPTKFRDSYHFTLKNKKGIYAFKLKTKDSFDNVGLDTRDHVTDKATSGTIVFKYMILEGDHTQNPPEYFEGIKSVGQDVDEISVLSAKGDGNLFNVNDVVSDYSDYYKCNEYIKYENGRQKTYLKQDFEPNTQYSFTFKVSNSKASSIPFICRYTDGTYEKFEIINSESNKVHTSSFTSSEGKSIKEVSSFYSDSGIITLYLDGTCINKGTTPIPYTPYKEDKKRILYYNDETQQWEKPILREWDSIEKHSDGKYYYHKRSGEVVLDGSEKWRIRPDVTDDGVHAIFSVFTSFKYNKSSYMICDKFNPKSVADANEAYSKGEGITYYTYIGGSEYAIYYVISKSKLSSQDVAGLTAWLQANPATLVYQLETEEVYECTSIDLITYENETNFIVNAGAIAPVSTLKVMCNINNVVRELQKKVSNLENYIQHVMIDALNNALNE